MYSTGDPARDFWLSVFAGLILVLAIVALIPWGRATALRRALGWLPALTLPVYGWYEYLMPDRFDIRIDLLLIWPLVIIAFIGFLIRLMRRQPR